MGHGIAHRHGLLAGQAGRKPGGTGDANLPAALVWAALPARLGQLAGNFGRRTLMVLGMTVAAASSCLIPVLGSLEGLAVMWALQALCYAAADPAGQALVADMTGGDHRGQAYGVYAKAAGLGATLGPWLGSWLYDVPGLRAPFLANGIVLAARAVALMLLFKVQPARDEAGGIPALRSERPACGRKRVQPGRGDLALTGEWNSYSCTCEVPDRELH